MIKNKTDFVTGVLLMMGCAALFHASFSISRGLGMALGPTFFPRMLLGCIGTGALILTVRSLGKPEAAPQSAKKMDRDVLVLRSGLVALFFLYLLALPILSYKLATFLFSMAGMLFLGPKAPRNIAVYAVASLVVTFGLEFVFAELLHLFLP